MNDRCQPTQFDCLRLDADIVCNQPDDDVIFLLSLYEHLERECDSETDRLEHLADEMGRRTEITSNSQTEKPVSEATWPAVERSLNVLERAEIAGRFRVSYHIFGTIRASRGGKDLEFAQLEAMELKIRNYLAQMAELEAEIAAAVPSTPEGVMLKLHFLSGLCKEGSNFATDVLPYVVDQSVGQLSDMLTLSLAEPAD